MRIFSVHTSGFGTWQVGRQRIVYVLACLLVASAGTLALLRSKAATPVIGLETESGVLANGSTTIANQLASSNTAVLFASGSSGSLPAIRGFIESTDGAHNALFKQLGFTAAVSPATSTALDTLNTQGLKGLVWVGDYDNTACQHEKSDATITSIVNSVKNHPALLGYYISDEPEQAVAACPNVATQLKARSDLIRSLDPNTAHITFQIISNQGTNLRCYDYTTFMGVTDVMGLDIYPFRQNPAYVPCVSDPTHPLNDISQAISAFNTQSAAYKQSHPSFVPRFYAVAQDFEDTYWRRPTVAELQQQFAAWQNSGMEGWWYFSWDWQGNTLDGNTAHQCEFKIENQVVLSC